MPASVDFRSGSTIESLESRIAPAGVVLISTAGGHLTITGDNSDNIINIARLPDGSWSISGADTEFRLNGGEPSPEIEVQAPSRNVVINTHGGADTIFLEGLVVSENLRINTHGGDDAVSFSGGTVRGRTWIDAGADNDNGGVGGVFGGPVTIMSGAGDDSFVVNGGTYSQGVSINLGTGSNYMAVTDQPTGLYPPTLDVYGNLTIVSSGAADTLQQFEINTTRGNIHGNLSISAPKGTTELLVNNSSSGDLNIDGNLTLRGGSVSTDVTVNFGLNVAGSLAFQLAGNGRNEINFAPTSDVRVRSIIYQGGSSYDLFNFEGGDLHVASSILFNGGRGEDRLELEAANFIYVGSGITFNGGTGADALVISSGNYSTIIGAVRFNGAAEASYFQFTNARVGSIHFASTSTSEPNTGNFVYLSGLEVHGSVNSNMGRMDNVFNLLNSTVFGRVSVTSHADANHGIEILVLQSVTVRGDVSLSTSGTADTEAMLANVIINGALRIATGGGNDTVRLGSFDAPLPGPAEISQFRGGTSINLGAGDDVFEAGGATSTNGNIFLKYMRVHGGAGNDTARFLNGHNNSFASFTPALFSLETVS